MSNPQISVIMSVYNTKESYLREAIKSILNQTFSNFEFIIINDSSTDNSINVIRLFNDNRIILINNSKNLGLTKSLNIGLQQAKGKYIARMDADDIALPERLQKQYDFMEKRKDIAVLGGMAIGFGSDLNKHKPFGYMPIDNEIIRIRMLFFNAAFPHSSAFIRTSFLKGNNLNYDEKILKSQDYDLWIRCLHYGKLYSLPEVIILYRIHADQITNKTGDEQKMYKDVIRLGELSKLTVDLSKEEKEAFLRFIDIENKTSIRYTYLMIQKLISSNLEKKIYDKELFKREILLWLLYKTFNRVKRLHDISIRDLKLIIQLLFPTNLIHIYKYLVIPKLKIRKNFKLSQKI